MRTADLTQDPTRPTIAWDIARCVATVAAAAGLVEGVEVGVWAAVADGLAVRTTGRRPRCTLGDVLVDVVATHASAVSSAAGSDVAFDDVVEVASDAWRSAPNPGPLELYLAALTTQGVPSEQLCWAVVGFQAQHHINLIWHEANKLVRVFPERAAADLFGWGWQGLRVALRKYDPAQGFKFSTYACQRINGMIRDGVRSENPVPKRLTTFQRKVAKAEEDLAAELGRTPNLAEVAERLGETLEALRIMPRLSPAASLEELASLAAERGGEPRVLTDDGDPADEALRAGLRDAILVALDGLAPDEAEAVRLLVYEGRSVAEAREVTGATTRQLRQRCARGKDQLAVALAGWR